VELAKITLAAHKKGDRGGEIVLSNSAQELFVNCYPELVQNYPGVLGPILARGAAQVRRLAQVYCLLDGREIITDQHLEAALCIWRYSSDSSRMIFGTASIDRNEDRVLEFLADGPKSRDQVRSELFRRNMLASELDGLIGRLATAGRIVVETQPQPGKKGRPTTTLRKL